MTVVLTSTGARIEGWRITAYKGIVRGETWNELLRHAEEVGANAVLNTRFDNALDVDTLFHGAAVVIEHFPSMPCHGHSPTNARNQIEARSPRDR